MHEGRGEIQKFQKDIRNISFLFRKCMRVMDCGEYMKKSIPLSPVITLSLKLFKLI